MCSNSSYLTETSQIRDWEFGIGGEYEYRKCLRCRQVQLHPFPTIEELMIAYPENYSSHVPEARARRMLYDILFFLANFGLRRKLQKYIKRGAKVLDVGCGNGEFLLRLKEIGAETLQGIDFSEKAVNLAKNKRINVFQGLFVDFQDEPSSYDAVFMNNYIEHMLNPIAELQKARELIRSGGILVGETPNFGSVDRKLFGRYWGGNHVPRHTFQYDKKQLTTLLLNAGFKEVFITSELNTGTIAASIQNYLQRNIADLRNNPKLKFGRMHGFELLLLAMIPFNIAPFFLGKSGVMKFIAVA